MAERMAHLAMTEQDHLNIGSTPPQELVDNPGKQWHELMDDKRLEHFIMEQIVATLLSHRKAADGDPRGIQMLNLHLNDYLAPNIAYLQKIGRIPEGLENFDPMIMFALPERADCYFVTGEKDGDQLVSWDESGKDWAIYDESQHGLMVNARGVVNSIDEAERLGIVNVRVRYVYLGRELTGDEIRALRREERGTDDTA